MVYKRSSCQDRLGTNIEEVESNRRFLQRSSLGMRRRAAAPRSYRDAAGRRGQMPPRTRQMRRTRTICRARRCASAWLTSHKSTRLSPPPTWCAKQTNRTDASSSPTLSRLSDFLKKSSFINNKCNLYLDIVYNKCNLYLVSSIISVTCT